MKKFNRTGALGNKPMNQLNESSLLGNKRRRKFDDNASEVTAATADVTRISDSDPSVSTLLNRFENARIHDTPSCHFGSIVVSQRSAGKLVRDELESMANNLYDETIQQKCCASIARWALDDCYRVIIVSSGGINHITTVMLAHRSNADIQTHCCVALGYLANNLMNKAKITAANGIKAIILAIKFHPSSQNVQSSASFALKQITAVGHTKTESVRETKTKRLREAFQATISDVTDQNHKNASLKRSRQLSFTCPNVA